MIAQARSQLQVNGFYVKVKTHIVVLTTLY